MADYRHDLEFGLEGEDLANELLRLPMNTAKVEVKRDRKVSETGNLAIEISLNGETSGLMTSSAHWWAFVLSGDAFNDEIIIFIETQRLKNMVGKLFELNGSVSGGDGWQSQLVLVPLNGVPGLFDISEIGKG